MSDRLTNIINNTSLNDVITLSVPPHKRKPIIIAFLHACARPLIDLFDEFKAYREDTLYEINYDGSTIHMEKFLNDHFNTSGGFGMANQITITTNVTINPLFVPDKEYGGDTVWIHDKAFTADPVYVGDKAYYQNQYDFTVDVPAALYATIDQNEFKTFINKYKLAGKTYNITTS